MELERESTRRSNWLDLPIDLTANILQRHGTFEIVTSACRVCPQWWNICKDPLMWRSIHMRLKNCDSVFDYYNNDYTVKICCKVVERSCYHLEDIDIETFGNDDLLEWIAKK